MKWRQRLLFAGIFAVTLSTSVCDYIRMHRDTVVHCPDLTPAECRQQQDMQHEFTGWR